MPQLQILAIPSSSYVFGTENMVLGLFEQLARLNKSHFLISRWSDGEFARRLEELGYDYTYTWMGTLSRVPSLQTLRWTVDCLRRLPELYWDVARVLARHRPDLIYISAYKQLLVLWPVLRLLPTPVVCHIADPPVFIPFQRRLFRVWDGVVDLYVPISESVRTRLEQFGVPPEKMALVHPGIDLAQLPFSPQRSQHFATRFGWPADTIIVGMTGQMIAAKGHVDFIEAAALLHRVAPNLRFVIGGKPQEPYSATLRALVEARGLAEVLAFAGWQEDVGDFYRSIDLFVLPSRQEEGFGLVAAEAMASGVPVVAARSGGAREIVASGVSGFLVDKQRPDQIAKALRLLANTPALRQQMALAGRQRVEALFSLGTQAAAFDAVLTRFVQQTRGAAA